MADFATYPTHFPCPNGCGNICNNADNLAYCPVCRRDLAMVEVQPPGTCWAWWGPSWHKMRCRRAKGHERGHDTHPDDWYAPYPSPALTASDAVTSGGTVDG